MFESFKQGIRINRAMEGMQRSDQEMAMAAAKIAKANGVSSELVNGIAAALSIGRIANEYVCAYVRAQRFHDKRSEEKFRIACLTIPPRLVGYMKTYLQTYSNMKGSRYTLEAMKMPLPSGCSIQAAIGNYEGTVGYYLLMNYDFANTVRGGSKLVDDVRNAGSALKQTNEGNKCSEYLEACFEYLEEKALGS